MANNAQIKEQIKSIKNTQKITKAMEMVAASKMRKCQETLQHSIPYAHTIKQIIGNIANASSEYQHDFMVERPLKRVGFIVISTDRGLCGGLNIQAFKHLIGLCSDLENQGVEVEFSTIGRKALNFIKSIGGDIQSEVSNLDDNPQLSQCLTGVQVLLQRYRNKEIDKIMLVSSAFVNMMVQKPKSMQLLPLEKHQFASDSVKHWDYIYEPDDAKVLLSQIIERYINVSIYHAILENKACEMSARMIAMKNASENAGNFIEDLKLVYNKSRQAAITQEISEIVSGAVALD